MLSRRNLSISSNVSVREDLDTIINNVTSGNGGNGGNANGSGVQINNPNATGGNGGNITVTNSGNGNDENSIHAGNGGNASVGIPGGGTGGNDGAHTNITASSTSIISMSVVSVTRTVISSTPTSGNNGNRLGDGDDNDSTSNKASITALIISAVLSGVAVAVIVVFLLYQRSRKRAAPTEKKPANTLQDWFETRSTSQCNQDTLSETSSLSTPSNPTDTQSHSLSQIGRAHV